MWQLSAIGEGVSRAAPRYQAKVHLRYAGMRNGVRCNASGEIVATDLIEDVNCRLCLNLHRHGVTNP